MHRSNKIFIALFFWFSAIDLRANIIDNPVEITRVDGAVSYLLPFTSNWRQINGPMRLPQGAMLKVDAGGVVDFNVTYGDDRGWGGEKAYFTLNDPIMMRLDENLLREINQQEYHQTRIPKQSEVDDGEQDDFGFLEYAWNRVVMMFRKDDSNSLHIDDLFRKAKLPVEVGVKSKKIRLREPDHGVTHYAYEYPASLKVLWEPVARWQGYYYIYIWPANASRPQYTERTRETYFELTVQEPGSYYVQVATANRRHLSPANLVHFGAPDGSGFKDLTYVDPVQPVFPPNDFNIVARTEKVNAAFSWTVEPGSIQSLKLVAEDLNRWTTSQGVDKDGNEVTEKVRKMYTFDLEPESGTVVKSMLQGAYRWWLAIEYLPEYRQAHSNIRLDPRTPSRVVRLLSTYNEEAEVQIVNRFGDGGTFFFQSGL